MRYVLLATALTHILAGCAAMGTQFPKSAVGRVIEISKPSVYEHKKPTMIPVLIGGLVVLIYSNVTAVSSTRIFTIQLLDGNVIVTTSEREFDVGTCVELKHAADLTLVTPKTNHVDGLLSNGTGC